MRPGAIVRLACRSSFSAVVIPRQVLARRCTRLPTTNASTIAAAYSAGFSPRSALPVFCDGSFLERRAEEEMTPPIRCLDVTLTSQSPRPGIRATVFPGRGIILDESAILGCNVSSRRIRMPLSHFTRRHLSVVFVLLLSRPPRRNHPLRGLIPDRRFPRPRALRRLNLRLGSEAMFPPRAARTTWSASRFSARIS